MGMSRTAMVVAAMLFAGAAVAQTPTPAAGTGAQTSGNGTQSTTLTQGASPSRANGSAPAASAPGTSGTPGRSGSNGTPGGSTGGGTPGQPSSGANATPAPLGNGKVEIIGRPSMQRQPSEDKPLLPIASLANAVGIPSGTPLRVRLKQTVDSGHARNGDMLDGTLTEAVGKLKSGTPVRLTVVQASRAGAILSYGELSLQVVAVGPHNLLSETISAQGQEGKKELPDAAPARGTEAVFTSDEPITLPAA